MPSSLIYANRPSDHLIAQVTHSLYCPTWLKTKRWVTTLGHFHQSFSQFWHECFWKVYLLRIVGWLREISFWLYWLFYGPPFSPVDSKDRRNGQRSISLADIAVHFELPFYPVTFFKNLCFLNIIYVNYAFNILFPLKMSGQRFTERICPAIWQFIQMCQLSSSVQCCMHPRELFLRRTRAPGN